MLLNRVAAEPNLQIVVAHTAHVPKISVELCLKKGSRVVLIDATSREDWWFGVLGRFGRSGWFPSDKVEPLDIYVRAILPIPVLYSPLVITCNVALRSLSNHALLLNDTTTTTTTTTTNRRKNE